jgi:hypothetical protein
VLLISKRKRDLMKISLLFTFIFFTVIIIAGINHYTGITGTTKLSGGDGCICHDFENNDSVLVWIEGPDSVSVADTASYKIFLTGGPAVAGGFNIASRIGEFVSHDTTTYLEFEELTHSFPLEFTGDTIYWNFDYVSSDTTGTDTIYSVANSVNLDGNPQVGDEWNFGENFVIHIIDNPVNVKSEEQPDQFYLAQNYPNPFNPVTTILFSIRKESTVVLEVFDVLGNEVAILVNEDKQPGSYNVEFRMNNVEFSSGVYLYQLIAGSFIETKKMILLR